MGQIGQDMQNKNVVDPRQAQWGDLDTNEKLARVGAQGIRGLGNGMQNYYQQAGALRVGSGGMAPIQTPPTPAIQPQIYNPNNGQQWAGDFGNNGKRNFYGG